METHSVLPCTWTLGLAMLLALVNGILGTAARVMTWTMFARWARKRTHQEHILWSESHEEQTWTQPAAQSLELKAWSQSQPRELAIVLQMSLGIIVLHHYSFEQFVAYHYCGNSWLTYLLPESFSNYSPPIELATSSVVPIALLRDYISVSPIGFKILEGWHQVFVDFVYMTSSMMLSV